jgi:hypothetical protein
MKRKLKITKQFTNQDKSVYLSPGTEFEKFSVSKDMFEDKVNYIVKVNKTPLLIPGDYAEIIYGGEEIKSNQK